MRKYQNNISVFITHLYINTFISNTWLKLPKKISKAKQHLEAELSTKIQQKRQKQSSVLTRLYYYHKNENNNEVDHIKRPGRGHRHKHMY